MQIHFSCDENFLGKNVTKSEILEWMMSVPDNYIAVSMEKNFYLF